MGHNNIIRGVTGGTNESVGARGTIIIYDREEDSEAEVGPS